MKRRYSLVGGFALLACVFFLTACGRAPTQGTAALAPMVQMPAHAAAAPQSQGTSFPPPSTAPLPARIEPIQLTKEQAARRPAADMLLRESEALDGNAMNNVAFLKRELSEKQYDAIEAQLDAVLKNSLADPRFELVERDCANFGEDYSNISSSDEKDIEAWVKARPKSPWAHYAMALRWNHDGWIARGSGWASGLTQEQVGTMDEDQAKALVEIRKALSLNPKISIAWVTLMDIELTTGGLPAITKDYAIAAKQHPASFLIADKYEQAIEPQWYGDYDQMDKFAQGKLAALEQNPRFWRLQGNAAADRGCISCNDYDWGASLSYYRDALRYGDQTAWLEGAGDAAMQLHRYGLAHAYYARTGIYVPGDFSIYTYAMLTDAMCNPSAPPGKADMLEKSLNQTYPRATGDCDYYLAELPWSDESAPDPGPIQPYSVQLEAYKGGQK